MAKTIEDYQNIIELLKHALKYYADEDHYIKNRPDKGEKYSSIELDSGIQARFALKKLDEFNEIHKKMENDFMNFISSSIESNESPEKIIEDIKKHWKNGDKNI
jgi:hypothetical protein